MTYRVTSPFWPRRLCIARHSLCACRRVDDGSRHEDPRRSHHRRQGGSDRAVVAAIRVRPDRGDCAWPMRLCLWCAFRAIKDPDGYGRSLKGIVLRSGVLLTGAMFLGFAGYAVRLAFTGMGGVSTSDDPAARDWTAWLMAQPFGPWLVGGIGFGFIGAAVGSVYAAWRTDFQAEMMMSPTNAPMGCPRVPLRLMRPRIRLAGHRRLSHHRRSSLRPLAGAGCRRRTHRIAGTPTVSSCSRWSRSACSPSASSD